MTPDTEPASHPAAENPRQVAADGRAPGRRLGVCLTRRSVAVVGHRSWPHAPPPLTGAPTPLPGGPPARPCIPVGRPPAAPPPGPPAVGHRRPVRPAVPAQATIHPPADLGGQRAGPRPVRTRPGWRPRRRPGERPPAGQRGRSAPGPRPAVRAPGWKKKLPAAVGRPAPGAAAATLPADPGRCRGQHRRAAPDARHPLGRPAPLPVLEVPAGRGGTEVRGPLLPGHRPTVGRPVPRPGQPRAAVPHAPRPAGRPSP